MSVDNKLKREEYTLFKFKQLIELFVKNSTLCLYENIEDFIKDHNYLTKFENELKKVINDDDMYGCQTFEHLHNIKNKIINNIEIFDDEGIDRIKVKEEIVRSFLKNVVVNKESHKNEEN